MIYIAKYRITFFPERTLKSFRRKRTVIFLIFASFFYGFAILQKLSKIGFLWRREILFITPTIEHVAQLAELTRLSQTLSCVSDIHWIIVEDSEQKSQKIERLLNRTKTPFTHLAFKTPKDFPGRGWAQRNFALRFVRDQYKNSSKSLVRRKVVYFGDDDNSYDIRLFDSYIRKVKAIGVWAVGFAGGGLVEAPRSNNQSKVIGWDTAWKPQRPFGVDMAGFAVNLDLILSTNATFADYCAKKEEGPESCFIEQLGMNRTDLQLFGVDGPLKEVLVWHTKTQPFQASANTNFGYVY